MRACVRACVRVGYSARAVVHSVSIYAWHTCMYVCMYVCMYACMHGCISNAWLYLCICYVYVLAQTKEESEAINLLSDPISCGWLRCVLSDSRGQLHHCNTCLPTCLPAPLPKCPLCISPPRLSPTHTSSNLSPSNLSPSHLSRISPTCAPEPVSERQMIHLTDQSHTQQMIHL